MKIDTGEMLAAAKVAASIAGTHSIPSFSKVWLLENRVAAFDGAIGVSVPVPNLPKLGGIEGKMLAALLNKLETEEVEFTTNEDGTQLNVISGRSISKLQLADPTSYIPTEPAQLEGSTIPTADLLEIQLQSMLLVKLQTTDNKPDFHAVQFKPGDGKVTLYSSDRVTIHKSVLETSLELNGTKLVPLDFLRALVKMWALFEDGSFTITNEFAAATLEDGTKLYGKLSHAEVPVDFSVPTNNVWPGQKVNSKLAVPIPSRLPDAVERASVLAKADVDKDLTLTIKNNVLTVSAKNDRGEFTESMKLKADHPPMAGKLQSVLLKRILSSVDRMYLGERALAMLGPQRFTTYISTKAV